MSWPEYLFATNSLTCSLSNFLHCLIDDNANSILQWNSAIQTVLIYTDWSAIWLTQVHQVASAIYGELYEKLMMMGWKAKGGPSPGSTSPSGHHYHSCMTLYFLKQSSYTKATIVIWLNCAPVLHNHYVQPLSFVRYIRVQVQNKLIFLRNWSKCSIWRIISLVQT